MAYGLPGRGNSGGSKGFILGPMIFFALTRTTGTWNRLMVATPKPPSVQLPAAPDFHKGIVALSMFPPNAYSQSDDSYLDVTATVEKTMKKYVDNLLRFLEGISSRLSQLELYCYNLDKSIGEMRSDLVRDNEDADSMLKSIEKHLQEVHRSVQILRDKQELAETQKELAKLQLAGKDSTSSSHSQSTEEKTSPPASDSKRTDHSSEMQNQQLALALPHQVVVPHSQALPQNLTQQSYYQSSNQLSNPHAPVPTPSLVHIPAPAPAPPPLPAPGPTQHTQSQYLPPDQQYQTPHIQDMSRMQPQSTQTHLVPPSNRYLSIRSSGHYKYNTATVLYATTDEAPIDTSLPSLPSYSIIKPISSRCITTQQPYAGSIFRSSSTCA